MSLPFHILRYDSVASTNTEAARQAAAGAAEGLCVVAREQTAGRGRQERRWASPRDAGLYFSLVLRPRFEPARWPLITMAAALAVRDALAEACRVEADIKWPNDLLARGRKLCGILAETCETPAGRACVLGVGVNLTERAFPAELAGRATSVEAETGQRPDTDALLRALTRALDRWYDALGGDDGARRVVAAWEAGSTYARGARVRVRLASESFEGVTRGLEPDGALRVETEAGRTRLVRAGDVTGVRAVNGEP